MSSPPITTRLTKLLGSNVPIISAPMAFAACPALVVAVNSAGGFGFIGAGLDSSETLVAHVESARSLLGVAANLPAPIGVGLVGWVLDMTEASNDPRLPALLEARPKVLWFAFGANLGKYIAQVHACDAQRDHKTIVFCVVHSAAQALIAANDWKVDVLVAEGIEAGGHGGKNAPPTSILVQSIIDILPANSPLVVAAGGISTGPQVASMLTLGADGVVMGTRFLFTNECIYSGQMKEVLIDADLQATKRSRVFDEVFRTPFWPGDIDGRAIANSIITDSEEGVSLEERQRRYDESAEKGGKDHLVIWAGVVAGLTKDIRPASDVLREVHEAAYKALKTAASLV